MDRDADVRLTGRHSHQNDRWRENSTGEQEKPAPTANEPSRASDGWGNGGFDMDTARAGDPASIR